MKAGLSDELRRAINESGNVPVEVEDYQTNRVYYLVPREQYEQFRELLGMEQVNPSLYEFTDEVLLKTHG